MKIKEYQELAMRTNDGKCTDRLLEFINTHKDIDTGALINACEGISGEGGEVNDLIKKWIFNGHEIDMLDLKKEIGDVCWYLALTCESLGFSFEEITEMNIHKLMKRYPEGFSEQASINRTE